MAAGSCLCGAVRFTIYAPLKDGDACHCSQCRKQSGHYWASTNVKRADLQLEGEDKLTWYKSSDQASRGFCSTCGSALFWQATAKPDRVAVALGAIDNPTGAKLGIHIFVADKGDYYEIADGLPQNQQ
ncbi:MAG: GFA family protein [Hyphomonadaceae bacterium]|nr:GFA family protein [Hyphomonadaceae bacterium]